MWGEGGPGVLDRGPPPGVGGRASGPPKFAFFKTKMSFWGALLGPFGLPFGSLWAPKLAKNRSKTLFFQKNMIFRILSATRGKTGSVTSRGHRKRPKIAPRRPQDGLKEVLFRCSISSSILVRFGCHFGAILGPQDGHFWDRFLLFFGMSPQGCPKRRQEAPKGGPRGSKRRPGRPQERPKRPPRGHNRPQKYPKRSEKTKRRGKRRDRDRKRAAARSSSSSKKQQQ